MKEIKQLLNLNFKKGFQVSCGRRFLYIKFVSFISFFTLFTMVDRWEVIKLSKGSIPTSPELVAALKEVNEETAKIIKAINESEDESFKSGIIYDFASRIFTKGYNFNK